MEIYHGEHVHRPSGDKGLILIDRMCQQHEVAKGGKKKLVWVLGNININITDDPHACVSSWISI